MGRVELFKIKTVYDVLRDLKIGRGLKTGPYRFSWFS
jgi:hypothetical protein